MAAAKQTLLKGSMTWHRRLGWTGGLALLLFAISGMMHPLMTWTGPQAASFFPPQAVMTADAAAAVPRILERHGIARALVVKVVPAPGGPALQVTGQHDLPRRYFDLKTGQELKDHDERQALWLARHYTGLTQAPVKSIVFQTRFDSAYPWVNRLLPVYRIEFATPDQRTAFIHTELGALGNLTNDWKTRIQGTFGALHTWNWLDRFEHARVFLMMILLLSLFGMAATGTAMVFLMKSRKHAEGKRRWHRVIAYAVWIPLLAFSASGSYHLLYYAYGEHSRGPLPGASLTVTPEHFGRDTAWLKPYKGTALNSLSIVKGPDGTLLYRLGIPQGKPGEKIGRAKRFDGVPIEKPALYFDALGGQESVLTDRDMAVHYAGAHLGRPDSAIQNVSLITRFGPDYDFRNKRLPVWRVDYGAPYDDTLFIDPATGIPVDRVGTPARYESYAFSFLHKWNFLTPLVGREIRDALVVATLLAAIGFSALGYLMLARRKGRP